MNVFSLRRGLQKAIRETPKLMDDAIIDSKLEDKNRANLLDGKDSEGNDMPFYSPNSEYGFEKMRRNPRNRGHWDLKNTGEYHKGIFIQIKKNRVLFKQRIQNAKSIWIAKKMELANRTPLGMKQSDLTKILKDKIPGIKNDIEQIIKRG